MNIPSTPSDSACSDGGLVLSVIVSGSAIYIMAPEDGYISEIIARGSEVEAGNKIVKIKSLDLEATRSKIQDFSELLKISHRPYVDGRVAKMIEGVKEEARTAEAHRLYMRRMYRDHRIAYEQGIIPRFDYTPHLYAARAAKGAARQARLKAELAEQRAKDIEDRILLAISHLEAHASRLDTIAEMLTILAPSKGSFHPYVGLQGFVKRGEPCGEIRP